MNRGAMPTQVEVVFDEGGLDERVTVSLNADGTFSGSLSYEQVAGSQYGISVSYTQLDVYKRQITGK